VSDIAILETGKPPEPLSARFGRYPDMFRRLLGCEAASYDVAAGAWPAAPDAYRAYLITGSPAGVYEDHGWIAELKAFVRSARGARLVGICFGHQLLAEAFGGRVVKSHRGWGVGLHSYRIVERQAWMDGETRIAVPASHQDQVVVQPPETDIVAASAFTPFAALAWRDRPAISFQFHPEFSPEFAQALIESRRDRVPQADAAIATLEAPNDSAAVGGWIRRFLAP
jgi:GMP synthase-like glutamine amidotransferase